MKIRKVRDVCPSNPFDRKYEDMQHKKLDINDSKLYEGGTYIHSLCVQDDKGYADEAGRCTKDAGACLAQDVGGACTCRDRATKTLRMRMEGEERARRVAELKRVKGLGLRY